MINEQHLPEGHGEAMEGKSRILAETGGRGVPKRTVGSVSSVAEQDSFFTEDRGPLVLRTAFQPIYSLAHQRIVGYEALLRARDRAGLSVPPGELFHGRLNQDDLLGLERRSHELHLRNFLGLGDEVNWLFLNVSPRMILEGHNRTLTRVIERAEVPPRRIVIEVVEQPADGEEELLEVISRFRELGCLIALDDFGAGHSNFDRIWTINPDIVKLDRSFIVRAGESRRIRNMVPGIISLLHQSGALVLMEGVETDDQAMIAFESDADLVQGYLFGKPVVGGADLPEPFGRFGEFSLRYRTASSAEEARMQREISLYARRFGLAVESLKSGAPLESSSGILFEEKAAVRCYLIGRNGIQIGRTVVSPDYHELHDERFLPLEDSESANWYRRHYLKRAILHPGQLQVTRPYLSITGAHMCITLSLMFSGPGGDCILCCDLTTGPNPGLLRVT